VDQNGCPDDYDDLVRNYYGMARAIVTRYARVHANDIDDLTQDMMLKFYAKRFLDQYDPNKTFQTPSGPRTARFPTLFRSFVKKFLRTPVETIGKRAAREPVRLEQPVSDGLTWMEVHAPVIDGDSVADEAYVTSELDRAYRHLASVQLGPNMTGDVVLRAMVEADETRRSVVADRLGVADTTASRWIKRVRLELNNIGFLQDPGYA
jgi:hypothetical protein